MGSSMPGYFFVLFFVAAVCGLVNRRKGRRVLNSFKVGAWAVAIVFAADLAFAFYLINVKNITSDYWQGRIVGGVFVGALVPLIVGILLAKKNAKQMSLEPPAA